MNIWHRLRQKGVLGINARNREFVMRYNQRSSYPLVDDKLKTKQLAQRAGIAVPELYGVVATPHDLLSLDETLGQHHSFVIKPAHGSGGNGVLVINKRRKGMFVKPDGRTITLEEVEYLTSNILSGVFSLGGTPDKAMIEYRVQPDPVFDQVSYLGVPDIRLLVYKGVPAMAMVRLPTRDSDGKANLHQGAIGAGIDIDTGITTHGVWHDRIIDEHPDFGAELSGIQIPAWQDLLQLGSSCHHLTGLGYLGVDIVLDKQKGPLILEINARPGLGIQIANQKGLQTVFDHIDALAVNQ